MAAEVKAAAVGDGQPDPGAVRYRLYIHFDFTYIIGAYVCILYVDKR